MSEKPFDLIHGNLDKVAYVYLKDGRCFKGILLGYDKDLNIALGDASSDSDEAENVRVYERIIIRRNNILSIANDTGFIWEE